MPTASAFSDFNRTADGGLRLDPRELEQAVARLDTLAGILDSVVRIPGTDIRIGVDALVGLVPVLGDFVTTAMSSYIIYEARRLGASRWTLSRMAANTSIDAVVGAVPIVGDVFDVMFRANRKNMVLLKRHLERQGGSGSSSVTIDGTASRIS